jgi:hypothetical protein
VQRSSPCELFHHTLDRKHDDGDPVIRSLASTVRLGLHENWQQFFLLVLINAFVGGMVGLERTVVPLIGSEQSNIEPRPPRNNTREEPFPLISFHVKR